MTVKKAFSNLKRRVAQHPTAIRIRARFKKSRLIKLDGLVERQWPDGYLFRLWGQKRSVWLPRRECIWLPSGSFSGPLITGKMGQSGIMELPRALAQEVGLA